MNDCLFCNIVKGAIPCEKIYEDERVFGFLYIHPINRGHTLLIPKKHAESIYNMPRKDFQELMGAVHVLAPHIKKAMKADGINIGMNNDRAAGQLVFHAHIHIIPRFADDGHRHWHGTPYKEGEIKSVGETVRKTLKEN